MEMGMGGCSFGHWKLHDVLWDRLVVVRGLL